MQYLKTYFIV